MIVARCFSRYFLAQRHLTTFSLGGVNVKITRANSPELVPLKYLPERINEDKEFLRHLQWMLKKDQLGQDMFLIGYPGAYRRRLAMAFCELTEREVEYVSLSRDTTEADLKQRREMIDGSAVYVNQSALRAALEGRLLILEGVEKAERNVLPILNNLLENREMQLEDGRFLMRSTLYDDLKNKYSLSELDDWRLVRCSERFRVVSLGVPVPRFPGHPLDPPLRSRFQARFISGQSYEGLFNDIINAYPSIPHERLTRLMSLIYALRSEHLSDLPFFSLDNVFSSISLLKYIPQIKDIDLIRTLYPYNAICNDSSVKLIEELMRKFNFNPKQQKTSFTFESISDQSALFKSSDRGGQIILPVSTGDHINIPLPFFIRTEHFDELFASLIMSHSVGDFCLIGPQGCGKTVIIEALANILGARVTHVVLYADMTSREMLQQRETDSESGNTIWRNSALVNAALSGEWAVLGGLHRLEKGCLSVLNQLVSDRQLQLFDGSRLLSEERYDAIKIKEGYDDNQMASRGIYKIHPQFRVIALCDPPSIPGDSPKSHSATRLDWLSSEVISNFRFHVLPELSKDDEQRIIQELVPSIPKDKIVQLLEISHTLRSSPDTQLRDLSHCLSMRQMLRISRRMAQYPDETITNAVHRACLSKFLPKYVQSSLNELLDQFLTNSKDDHDKLSPYSEQLEDLLTQYRMVTNTTDKLTLKGEEEAKVPNVLFYDSVAHSKILLEMLQDFSLGRDDNEKQHILLIGNQGVGKNKIVDRFLYLLNRPREYIQLHRDTTVQTLTLQPSIKDGRLIYEDSGLVKAISKGHVLVVDEADKASTQVTCILKTLLTVGDMDLYDGRRIIPGHRDISNLPKYKQDRVIRIHPEFRMIVLANRPGFPFLGNDFFGAMGDVFSVHAVDNPDVSSEIEMLQKYGPSVPLDIIKKLVFLFTDLRDLADQGHIQYPYSTREIVNIIKHLETFPNDSLSTVLSNVFDFDLSNREMITTLETTLEKHGISLPGIEVKVSLAKELPLPPLQKASTWRFSTPKSLKTTSYKGSMKFLDRITPLSQKMETEMTRSKSFTELDEYVSLKFGEYNIVSDMISSNTNDRTAYLHMATLNPIKLYTVCLVKDNEGKYNKLSSSKVVHSVDLSDLFPAVQGSFRPHVQIASSFDGKVLLHETSTNLLLQIDTSTGEYSRLISEQCIPEHKFQLRPRWFSTDSDPSNQRQLLEMHKNWSSESNGAFIVFHRPGDNFLLVFNLQENEWHKIHVNVPLKSVQLVSKDCWVLQDTDSFFYIISRTAFNNNEFSLRRIYSEDKSVILEHLFSDSFDISTIGSHLDLTTQSPDMAVGTSSSSYADVLLMPFFLEEQSNIVSTIPRPSSLPKTSLSRSATSATLPASGIIVSSVNKSVVPKQCRNNQIVNATSISGYLEVVNLKQGTLKYLPIPSSFEAPVTFKWLTMNVPEVFVTRLDSDIFSLDNTGCIHKWTLCPIKLNKELISWKKAIGANSEDDRDLMIERKEEDVDTSLSGPKHGKTDSSGAPHVGGNTWAGGTGGRDTAGLGGIGGPYRLDAGHDVFQVPDNLKASVPESVKKAAREVAEKAWKDRLRQIHMSELDFELYMKYYKRVESQIGAIKVLIDTLQATAKERQWLRHRTHGDLDDGKLVEGVLGERTIYRARGDKEPEPGSPQQKPKRLRIVADASGSMYRFNGQDHRMERQLETILMLMESFSTVRKEKMVYDICGHSGEGPQFPFVNIQDPPSNEKQRMNVLMEILAHSQFCVSGDYTLEAIQQGITELRKTHDIMDQSFLIVLSDANLSRYGIPPAAITKLLLSDKNIQSYIIFIGSLGQQAEVLKKALPAGRSFVCMDNEQLPNILRSIFTTTLLS